jgi:hypothetical protein
MAGTRSLKPKMSPRSSASQIRKVPTVDNAAAFSALPAATCVFRASRGYVGGRSGHTEQATRCRSVPLHRQVP